METENKEKKLLCDLFLAIIYENGLIKKIPTKLFKKLNTDEKLSLIATLLYEKNGK